MKRRMMAWMGVLAVILVLAGGAPVLAATEIHLGTSAVGGIYYGLGVPLSQVVNKYLPEVQITPEITTGTMENLRLMNAGKLQMCISLPRETIDATKGEKPYTEKIPAATVVRLPPVINFFVVKADSKFQTIADLKGQRVNVAPVGGLEVNSKAFLAAYGIDYKAITPVFLGVGQGHEALTDGKVAATISTIPATNQALATEKLRVLWFDKAAVDKLVVDNPGIGTFMMPAGSIKGVDEVKLMPDVGCQLTVSPSADPELVYKITKTIVEHLPELTEAYATYRWLSKELAATGLGVPYHPGAIKYFKEVGLMK